MTKSLSARSTAEIDATFVDRARQLLVEAKTVYARKELRAQVKSIKVWMKEHGASKESLAHVRHAQLLIERGIGEFTKAIPKASKAEASEAGKRGGRGKKGADKTSIPFGKKAELKKNGLSEKQASRFEKLVPLSDKDLRLKAEREVARVKKAAGDKAAKVEHNTGQVEWYTPVHIIEIAKAAMGGIDLDPASCATANKLVGARRYYTKKDNGLSKKWSGRVWMNPPYEKVTVDAFAAKLVEEYKSGRVKAACVIVNNSTDTKWCQDLVSAASVVCLIAGRVHFVDSKGKPGASAPLQGQILVYLGRGRRQFIKAARSLGVCCSVA